MQWIGLTGGIATGKSAVSKLLEGRGIPVIDADRVARDVVEKGSPGLEKIVQAFGPGVLNSEGQLDRQKMGVSVFSDKQKLSQLESIIHPLVQAFVLQKRSALENNGVKLAVYDVPLLFEKNLEAQFDGVLVVGCRPEIQLRRLMERNGFSQEEAQRRIAAQLPLAEKKLEADWYIDNSGSVSELEAKVSSWLGKIQSGQI